MSTESNYVEDSLTLTTRDLLQGVYKSPDITYWQENDNDQSVWSISVKGNEPQEINMEWESITYGERPYFRCECGHRATKLYLPANSHEFKCRDCHNLHYQLTTFNRYSINGKKLYQLNRLNKLSNNRASMSRIFYEGKFTKRFERFLGQCEKAGFNSIVQGANDLKILMQK